MYVNIEAIKEANRQGGQSWFSPSTMRWWHTRVHSTLYPVKNGALFVTSEVNFSHQRVYTVRFADDQGRIHTVGQLGAYLTAATAATAARKYRRVWDDIADVVLSAQPQARPCDHRSVATG